MVSALREADQRIRPPDQSGNLTKQLLTIDDLAAILGESRSMAHHRVRQGTIPGVRRLGRSIRVSKPILDRWLESSPSPRAGERSG